jgi:hypothetical protein
VTTTGYGPSKAKAPGIDTGSIVDPLITEIRSSALTDWQRLLTSASPSATAETPLQPPTMRSGPANVDSIAARWPLVTPANGDDVTWLNVVGL